MSEYSVPAMPFVMKFSYMVLKYEWMHDMGFVPSDQHGHLPSLIRLFSCMLNG